ncbi:site-specific DNA-methyltransferase [Myxococcota bacterium]|nr:site-specific DNA-methyltransferase [Myxococcota bacterium]
MITTSLLWRGDNRDTLRALLPELAGSVRCVYLDPPYNTGAAQKGGEDGYADAMPREAWRAFMAERLELCRSLLSEDGSLWVQLDDNELDTTRLLLDELFGRAQFIARITVEARAPSAFSTVNKGLFKASEYLLWYARDRQRLRFNPQRVPCPRDRMYNLYVQNAEAPPESWRLVRLADAAAAQGLSVDALVLRSPERVARLASIHPVKAGRAILAARAQSLASPEQVIVVPREGHPDQLVLRGQQLILYDKQVSVIDGQRTPSRPLTNIWTDIAWEGIAAEGGARYKEGKKPERLLRRVLQLSSDPGDWVLDPFMGSGTTPAVAAKMGRRFVGLERGPVFEVAAARLERVLAGADPTGITKLEGYGGGGAMELRREPPEARQRAGIGGGGSSPA